VPLDQAIARLRAFLEWADRTGVEYFWFEGSDEPWKARYEGARGACWGLTDAAGVLKPVFRPLFDGPAAAP
jgi:exo-beta-1,3-glucanase (GH17 family)